MQYLLLNDLALQLGLRSEGAVVSLQFLYDGVAAVDLVYARLQPLLQRHDAAFVGLLRFLQTRHGCPRCRLQSLAFLRHFLRVGDLFMQS